MTYSTTSSYLAHKNGALHTHVKSEPGVYNLNRRTDAGTNAGKKADGKSGNNRKFKVRCYHCQKQGHFASECQESSQDYRRLSGSSTR